MNSVSDPKGDNGDQLLEVHEVEGQSNLKGTTELSENELDDSHDPDEYTSRAPSNTNISAMSQKVDTRQSTGERKRRREASTGLKEKVIDNDSFSVGAWFRGITFA